MREGVSQQRLENSKTVKARPRENTLFRVHYVATTTAANVRAPYLCMTSYRRHLRGNFWVSFPRPSKEHKKMTACTDPCTTSNTETYMTRSEKTTGGSPSKIFLHRFNVRLSIVSSSCEKTNNRPKNPTSAHTNPPNPPNIAFNPSIVCSFEPCSCVMTMSARWDFSHTLIDGPAVPLTIISTVPKSKMTNRAIWGDLGGVSRSKKG